MEQDQQQPSTSGEGTSVKFGTRFTPKQREIILVALGVARHRLNRPISGSVDAEFYRAFCDVLPAYSRSTKFDKPPSQKSVSLIWKQFVDPNSLVNSARKGGPKKLDSDADSQACLSAHGPEANAREIAEELNVTRPTISKRLQKEDSEIFFFHSRRMQFLNKEDCMRRVDFCKTFTHWIHHGQLDVSDICFTDELVIGVGERRAKQSDTGQLRITKGNEAAQVKSFDSLVRIFLAVHPRIGFIGPYFVDEITNPNPDPDPKKQAQKKNHLDGPKYEVLLRDKIIPELERHLNVINFRNCWWQQDGNNRGTAESSLSLLKKSFGDKIISKSASYEWPAFSPDLNPFNYAFWNEIKKVVGIKRPQTVDEIKEVTRMACSQITKEYIASVIEDFPIRMKACIEYDGRHFEPFLKEYKARQNIKVVCDNCHKVHKCDCQLCDKVCLESTLDSEDEDEDDDYRWELVPQHEYD